MSRLQSARLGLLAGSSFLAAAGLSVLTPTAAMAQATCTAPAAPAGNGTNTVTIAAGTYNPGVTCSYVGTGATVSTAGAITVSSTAGGNGINLSAAGAGVVNWNSVAGTVTAGAQTNGALIDATSETGAINITTASVAANVAGATHGIRATSTGGGDITIVKAAGGTINNQQPGSQAAVEAVTNGGDISISTIGNTLGRQRGILAQTSGAGGVELAIANTVSANATDGVAAIDVVAGTGGVNIDLNLTAGTINGGAGVAIRVASASAVDIDTVGGTSSLLGRVDFSGVTAGGVNLDINSGWAATGASVFSGVNDVVSLNVSTSLADGASMDFGAGADTLTSSATYTVGAASITFGAGADVLNISDRLITAGTTLNFGADADVFNMSAVWAMDGASISGLETLNNSGVILMGAQRFGQQNTPDFVNTDDVADDKLVMTGGIFTGSGDGRVVMDVLIGTQAQAGCATITAADCLDLRGASSAGTTLLTINNAAPDATLGAYNTVGVTLVDLGGAGTSAESHFRIDPDSAGYVDDPLYGAAIERPGLFRYVLQYDAANQRHVLVGLPRSEALEYVVLAGAAQSVWHMTADTVTDRQTDLRDGAEGGSVWLRASGEYTRRDLTNTVSSLGDAFVIDNGYKLYAGAVLGGMDFFAGDYGGFEYVLGGQIGYVSSSYDFDASESSGRFTGGTGGVYASLWSDWFFAGGTVNINGLTLDHDSIGLGSKTTTFLNSVGVQAETGLRSRIADGLFAEPLATLSYVRTSFEEISLTGGQVQPEDAKSIRGALGLRLGGTLSGTGASATYFVTGRAWNEFEGESGGVVVNPGADLPFADDFSGAFGEAEIGVNVYNPSNTLSGYISSGVKWKDGYSAVDLSLGVRMAW